ncbi:MAG: DUF4329 domain-containing protein [Litorimonas sp.]
MSSFIKSISLLGAGLVHSACVIDPVPYERPQPKTEAEVQFIKSVLDGLQTQSFRSAREYCGMLVLDVDGNFNVTEIQKGRASSCKPPPSDESSIEIASFHTHGAFSVDHDSEVPSSDDMEADYLEGNDGYVATPGGRVWYINGANMTAVLICGEGCIQADPNYVSENLPLKIGQPYTIEDLEDLLVLAE